MRGQGHADKDLIVGEIKIIDKKNAFVSKLIFSNLSSKHFIKKIMIGIITIKLKYFRY